MTADSRLQGALRNRDEHCQSKVRYITRAAAKSGARVRGAELRAYACLSCGWWHIGHSSAGFREVIREAMRGQS